MKKPMHQSTKIALFALGALVAIAANVFMMSPQFGQGALKAYGDGAGMLDMRLFYSGAEAAQSLGALGPGGARVYLRILLVDVAFIAGLALAMHMLVSWLVDAMQLPQRFRCVAWLGFARAAFDLVENALIAAALFGGGNKPELLGVAGVVTLLKWLCLGLYVLGVAFMLGYRTVKNLQTRAEGNAGA